MRQEFEEELERKPAEKVGVTPKEFAEAVADIENRRAANSGQNEEICIGDAIQQLGLSVSPDEVVSVIQQRKAEEAKRAAYALSKKRKALRILGHTVLGLSLALNIFLLSPLHSGSAPGGDGLLEQHGELQSISGKTGTVNFPQPYSRTPNIELTNGMAKTRIISASPTQFMWENTGPDDIINNTNIPWSAHGVR